MNSSLQYITGLGFSLMMMVVVGVVDVGVMLLTMVMMGM
jgi:hypothetical protein